MRTISHSTSQVVSKAKILASGLHTQSQRVFGSRRARSLGPISNYFRNTLAIGYAGWVGKANLGDEALYDAFATLFAEEHLISVNNPLPVELSLHAAFFRRKSLFKGVMLGGGTLIFHKSYAKIMDAAQEQGLPTVVFGTGVIDDDFWSERRAHKGYDPVKDLWRKVLDRARFVGVRGPDSDARLRELGITKQVVIGDPALSVCPPIRPRRIESKWKVGFNLGNIGPAWGSSDAIDQAYAETCLSLIGRGHSVDMFGLHRTDRERALSLVERFKINPCAVWYEYNNTHRALELLDGYDIVVAQKLHGVVLAAGLGIPCVSVAYEPKCVDFMRSIGMEDCVIRADKLTAQLLTDKINEIVENYNSVHLRLQDSVVDWQQKQAMAAKHVATIFSGLAPTPDEC